VWNDPGLAIAWPLAEPQVSDKDGSLPRLAEVLELLPRYAEPPLAPGAA
jgi:hypothetical protein